ncbi:helical backbone metal receptor [Candidatus Poriferisodalis sp.]|uniref:helical backbone metal receptor n=1 Tax=Candidatus Poriferisodalis sp. TaxID=3101277 RepID=UPI003B014ED9
MRIISLVPSVTETLAAWGIDPIACTSFCERPDLPHIGGTKNPDIAAIAALAPDLLVVDREENRKEDYDALVARGIEVEVLHIASLHEVEPELDRLAARIGVTPHADPLPRALGALWHPSGRAIRAFVPIWRRPLMSIGAPTYGASLLAWCGLEVAFASRGAYPTIDPDEAARANVDIVLAPTEPYPWHRRHLDELTAIAPTQLIDGQDLFWWGARTPAAIARLGETVIGALQRCGLLSASPSSVTQR